MNVQPTTTSVCRRAETVQIGMGGQEVAARVPPTHPGLHDRRSRMNQLLKSGLFWRE